MNRLCMNYFNANKYADTLFHHTRINIYLLITYRR